MYYVQLILCTFIDNVHYVFVLCYKLYISIENCEHMFEIIILMYVYGYFIYVMFPHITQGCR